MSIWLQNGYGCYNPVISSTGELCFMHWHWHGRQKKDKINFLLENIVYKCLYSERKATKMFVKTLFRIESYLRSTTYVRGLTCSTQHADFVLQDRIGENGRASDARHRWRQMSPTHQGAAPTISAGATPPCSRATDGRHRWRQMSPIHQGALALSQCDRQLYLNCWTFSHFCPSSPTSEPNFFIEIQILSVTQI